MGEQQQAATVLIASALDDFRAAARVLTESDTALSVKPSPVSNARWFVRMFVLRPRKPATNVAETFWTNLEFAQASGAAGARTLEMLFQQHGDDPVVQHLHAELMEVDQPGIVPALHGEAVPGKEAEASQRLRPVVARMKVCEARLLSAIQAIARRTAEG